MQKCFCLKDVSGNFHFFLFIDHEWKFVLLSVYLLRVEGDAIAFYKYTERGDGSSNYKFKCVRGGVDMHTYIVCRYERCVIHLDLRICLLKTCRLSHGIVK